jgi:hypothetical protein
MVVVAGLYAFVGQVSAPTTYVIRVECKTTGGMTLIPQTPSVTLRASFNDNPSTEQVVPVESGSANVLGPPAHFGTMEVTLSNPSPGRPANDDRGTHDGSSALCHRRGEDTDGRAAVTTLR